MTFVEAINIDQLEPGSGTSVEIQGKSIAVLRDDEGNFYAVEDSCPHAGYTMTDALIDDGCVECMAHGISFDLETGESQSPACGPLAVFPVEIDGEKVKIDLGA